MKNHVYFVLALNALKWSKGNIIKVPLLRSITLSIYLIHLFGVYSFYTIYLIQLYLILYNPFFLQDA